MIDIGFLIPRTGQYIMIIIGGLLILAGVILAFIYFISKKTNRPQEENDEIFEESKEIEQKTPKRRRSGKY
jgi:flagellar basal body-associated protein FliL